MSTDVHFTYSPSLDNNYLKQGDILEKTRELDELLHEVHPHYTNSDYTHFQVLTQSCDLVRRGSKKRCSSRYISLAAVRGLDTVISRIIDSEVEKSKKISIDGVSWCNDRYKSRVSQKIESLFNNNDKNHFFLKAYPEKGLAYDSCTFLHLSIAIRAYEHYDLCLQAKRIELESNFQSKLGWLVGNLYSRVGTEDFVPGCFDDKKDFDNYVSDTLDRHIAWVQADQFATFKSCQSENKDKAGKDLINVMESKLKEKKQNSINTFVGIIDKTINLDSGQKDKLKNLLDSSLAERFVKF